jgi:hypothetical protein
MLNSCLSWCGSLCAPTPTRPASTRPPPAPTRDEKAGLLSGGDDSELPADAAILSEHQIRTLVETQMALHAELGRGRGGGEDEAMEEGGFEDVAGKVLSPGSAGRVAGYVWVFISWKIS